MNEDILLGHRGHAQNILSAESSGFAWSCTSSSVGNPSLASCTEHMTELKQWLASDGQARKAQT